MISRQDHTVHASLSCVLVHGNFGILKYPTRVHSRVRTDRRSGPTTRPAFAKATQVKSNFCLYRKNSMQLRAFERYIPLCSHSKRRQKLVFKTTYRLLQAKSIAECSKGSILQCFRPSFSYHFVFKTFVLSIFEWPLKTGFIATTTDI